MVGQCSANICSHALLCLQAETKKEEFRKYLESAGVLDALTKGAFLSCGYTAILLLSLLLPPFPSSFCSSSGSV